jgi:hypothetical protein
MPLLAQPLISLNITHLLALWHIRWQSLFLSSPAEVKANIRTFTDIGADELILMPCIPELDQVRMLADCL